MLHKKFGILCCCCRSLSTWHFVVVTDTEGSVHRHANNVVENVCGFSCSCACRGS
ncbi:hypothetical protein C8Q74DRAFT_1233684 [Fomes fomentarius]|nr:hypothetical protein C8Q74DRAFT_1233684 [Fomes fomentarius]